MYASVRKYRIEPDAAESLTVRVTDGFVPIVSKLHGFLSYMVIDAGDGVVVSISVFESQEDAERSNEAAAQWVGDNISDAVLGAPDVTAGEIVVAAPRPAVW